MQSSLPQAVVLRRSKALFGNEHMLGVAAFIAGSDGALTLGDVCAATGIARTTAHRMIGTLTEVGLLNRLPRGSGERTQWYTRSPHAFWAATVELAHLDRPSPSEKRLKRPSGKR